MPIARGRPMPLPGCGGHSPGNLAQTAMRSRRRFPGDFPETRTLLSAGRSARQRWSWGWLPGWTGGPHCPPDCHCPHSRSSRGSRWNRLRPDRRSCPGCRSFRDCLSWRRCWRCRQCRRYRHFRHRSTPRSYLRCPSCRGFRAEQVPTSPDWGDPRAVLRGRSERPRPTREDRRTGCAMHESLPDYDRSTLGSLSDGTSAALAGDEAPATPGLGAQ